MVRVSPVELLPTLTTFEAPPSELFTPSATELFPLAVAAEPNAVAPAPEAVANAPSATVLDDNVAAVFPTAVALLIANGLLLVPLPALAPTATLPLPLTYCPAFDPSAVLFEPVTVAPAA
jgi:hypothetical protein